MTPTRIKGGGTWDAAMEAAGEATVDGAKVVSYATMPKGTQTYIMLGQGESMPCPCAGRKAAGGHTAEPHESQVIWIFPGDAIECGDLEDGSTRSRFIKGHIEQGIAVVV